MNRRPEKDMDNPPGQIVNKVALPRCASNVACTCSPGRCEDKDYGPGQVRYLRDVIRKYTEEDRKPIREIISDWQKFDNALASLRHLYANMVQGQCKDTAQAKRLAEGLLGNAIRELEGINNAKNHRG